MKKKWPLAVLVVAILALSLPLSNLVVGLPSPTLKDMETDDPTFQRALDILAAKCVNCHTEEYTLPFYANFPIARGIIEHDIHEGTRYVNYIEEIDVNAEPPISEVMLAKTEQTILESTMPPTRYTALHWDGGLNSQEREDLLAWIHEVRAEYFASGYAAPEFANEPVQPLPTSVELDEAKVALGDQLFHDTRLSRDNSVSCASCHDIAMGGTDQLQFAVGINDQVGAINSPTVFNADFQFLQFWDGRAADLEEQADGPVSDPIEMDSSWEEAARKLIQDETFTEAFTAVYPNGYNRDNFVDAIAEFERSLITPNARFDQYLMGDTSAMTPEEVRGYDLFKRYDCATCHVGVIMGGQSFEEMGRKDDYFGDRGDVGADDGGRYNVTGDEADRHHFKTPTLRNIALTFPYMHDGTVETLEESVDIMAQYIVGRRMSTSDRDYIVAFLHTLTGEYQGVPLDQLSDE